MALPDSGNVEDYSEEEMNQLLKQFEEDKSQLSKPQKAAVARYNFKKNKGQPIVFRGEAPPEGAEAPAAEAKGEEKPTPKPAAAAKPAAKGGGDIIDLLPPEIQELARKDPKELSKEDRIKVAKAKSQAVKAQQAAKDAGAPAEKKKSPEEIQREKWQKEVPQDFPWITELQEKFGDVFEEYAMQGDKPYVIVKAKSIRDVLRYAHDRMGFTYLANLTAADYPPDRMEVVYNVYNYDRVRSLAAKVIVPRQDPITVPSITPLFKGANWLEREVLDLFGIQFEGHPDPRRLMMPEGWTGHPLRKDYDITQQQYIAVDEAGNDVVSFKEEEGW